MVCINNSIYLKNDLNLARVLKYPFYFSLTHYTGVWSRAVTVADFYHCGDNGLTTAGGAVLCIFIYLYIYIYIYIWNAKINKWGSIIY